MANNYEDHSPTSVFGFQRNSISEDACKLHVLSTLSYHLNESSKVLRDLKLTEIKDFVNYVLSDSVLPNATDNKTKNDQIGLLLDQIDLNRNGKISFKELANFLYPAPGIRELGWLVKLVREGFIMELSKLKKVITSSSSDSDILDAMIRLANNIQAKVKNPLARALDMETFRAILESLKILESKAEVDCIIKAIDNNNDKRISEQELKGFLFPEPPENFVSLLEAKFIQMNTGVGPIVDDVIDEKEGTDDINSLANTFGQLLLAENGSESDTATTMFAALDFDGDGHLSMEEMKEVLLNFFLDLKQKDIEKAAREIRDILLQHLTHKEGGLIALAKYEEFLLADDSSLSPDVKAAKQLVASKLQLSTLSASGLAQVEETIKSADKDQDGFLLPSIVLDNLQQLLTDRCRQEEDASGKYALLFRHIDEDKNGTIEKKELLEFLRSLAPVPTPSIVRPFEQVERLVREKILERIGLAPATSSVSGEETDKKPTVADTSDFSLNAKFKDFLESIPENQNGLFRGDKCVNVKNIFVLVAIKQALCSLQIPELGDYPQLTTDEVSSLLKDMDKNDDSGLTLLELRSWLTRG
eukprot:gene25056-33568_t